MLSDLNTNDKELLINQIKQEMSLKKISLRSIARGAKISPSYLSEILQGKKKPSASIAYAIAEYLELPWLNFIQDSANPSKDEELIILNEIRKSVKDDPMLKNILLEILQMDDAKRKKALDAFSKAVSEIK